MTATLSSTSTYPWAGAIASPGKEFSLTELPILSGAIPTGLQGSLYRNGPGRLERGQERVGHWFDGDGAILAVHFKGDRATATYRYVQTAGYQAEAQAGQYLYGNYGMTPRGAFWKRPARATKNSANTSVLAVTDKLLALWEGGQPHALNLETLETYGIDELGGLKANTPYSAHPKRDPRTGEIFNFGVAYGRQAQIHIYRSNPSGQIQQQSSLAINGFPIVHDFVLAGPYLVFSIPPVRMNPFPVLALMQSYSDALHWQPEERTQIVIVDRDSLEVVQRIEAEPWFQWHFSNGWVNSDGTIGIDLVRYEDFQTNQFLKEVASGQTQTAAPGRLWHLRLDPQAGRVVDHAPLLDRPCEFPIVPPHQTGQPTRYTYLSIHRQDAQISREILQGIARFDSTTGQLLEADLGQQRYSSEPIYAADSQNPDRGWILAVVYDSQHHQSEVWIYGSDRLDQEPLCRLSLPQVIPPGFHGTWRPTA